MSNLSEVPIPETFAEEAIERWNLEGHGETLEPLKLVNECRIAMFKMPKDKTGLVIGSGENTGKWRKKGWKTLDIDKAVQPDFTMDANQLGQVIPPGTLDYLYSEYIVFDPKGRDGVGRGRLLQQANQVLKKGGRLIIGTAHLINSPVNVLPNRETFPDQMAKHGFRVVTEVKKIRHHGETSGQLVIYYGQKITEGFSPNITPKK